MRDLNTCKVEIDKIQKGIIGTEACRHSFPFEFATEFALLSDVIENGFQAEVRETHLKNSSALLNEFPDEKIVWLFRSDSVNCGRGGGIALLDDERCPEVVAPGLRHCLEEIQGVLTGVKKVPWA